MQTTVTNNSTPRLRQRPASVTEGDTNTTTDQGLSGKHHTLRVTEADSLQSSFFTSGDLGKSRFGAGGRCEYGCLPFAVSGVVGGPWLYGEATAGNVASIALCGCGPNTLWESPRPCDGMPLMLAGRPDKGRGADKDTGEYRL